MKILMLVNWKIQYADRVPKDKQPPDYYIKGSDYWFYRYFNNKPQVDVIDISSFSILERFEKKVTRFYIFQSIKAILKMRNYDLIVSHGMQSGIVLALWRRLFKSKTKHVVFDVGSFASASESGVSLKMMQFASKSIDGLIYHTSSQLQYYKKYFPWIVNNSRFIRFGTDLDFFNSKKIKHKECEKSYILCVGYSKRDWDTLIKAYKKLRIDKELRLVGHVEEKYKSIHLVHQIPYVSINRLIEQIYNADYCVLPLESFNYSYGQMTLMQQMALGKCVIVAKVPSVEDYTIDNKTVLMYEPKDVKSLVSKFQMIESDDFLKKKIGEAAKHYLKFNCNEKTMAHEIEIYLNELFYV